MSYNDKWTHKYTAVRAYPSYGPQHRIKVEAGLHQIGEQRPYFSVTAMIYHPRAKDCEACGCLHEDVQKFWPNLAPVIALHLSDDTGAPMHAEGNGWYSLAGYYQTEDRYHAGNSSQSFPKPDGKGWESRCPTPEECLQRFAEHVRIPVEEARELAGFWRCSDDWKATRRFYAEWIGKQGPRWQAEADAAVALLDSLIAKQAEKAAEKAVQL